MLSRFAHYAPVAATAVVCTVLYSVAAYSFESFGTLQVFINMITDNAVLGIAAIGLTFVILSGGIDLSVGAMVGLSSISAALLIERNGWHPYAAWPALVGLGTVFGATQGLIVHKFRLPAFLVTLAGMFLARGIALVLSMEDMGVSHSLYGELMEFTIELPNETYLTAVPLVFVGILFLGIILGQYSGFGRNTYALGGNEQASMLMGLPVGRTRVTVYAISGFCASLAGVLHSVYSQSGNATAGTGLELDAIAAVVIGGTLLTGGVGTIFGTFLGVLIFGIIQTAITFQGTLNSWWTRIVIAGLLLGFIVLQKGLTRIAGKRQH